MAEEKTVEISINETLAINRALPVVQATEIAIPPANYRPTPIEIRQRQLRRISEDLQAEVTEALREYAERGTAITKDLGDRAPAAETADSLLSRIASIQRSQASIESLRAYLNEIEEIALSDAVELLEKARKRIDVEAEDNAHLKTQHKKLYSFFEARSAAISEGIARAKEGREKASTEK